MARKLGDILIEKNKITPDQFKTCINIQKETGEKLGHILIEQRMVREEDIAEALAYQIGWSYYGKELIIDIETLKKLSLDFVERNRVFPVILDTGKPAIVYEDPLNTSATQLLQDKEVYEENNVVAPKRNIDRVIDKLKIQSEDSIVKAVAQLKESGIASGACTGFIDAVLKKAIAFEATDVHIEPSGATSNVRIRIDGMLYPEISLEKRFHNHIVNVVFDKANITASEFTKSHDAGFRFNYHNRDIDIRLSAIPTKYGSSVALRILELGKTLISLKDLGYHKDLYKKIIDAVRIPHGIILVTGPTGSGKTTTLYSILNSIKTPVLKIITIEDPVEIEVPGVQQCEVNEKDRESQFGTMTKRFLRQDPDIMLIGEIRDESTAREAMRASATGHKVFSTLHTNTAVESMLRLLDLGLGPSYIGSSVSCVISQRLVRKLCPNCKEIDKNAKHKDIVGGDVYIPKGCEACSGKGYRGRTVVAEVLQNNAEIKNAIVENNFHDIEAIAKKNGFKSIKNDAIRLVKEGITSLEEVGRVVGL